MRRITVALSLLLSVLFAQGQEIKISELDMKNLGDGRLYAQDKKEKPLDKKVRIITGYTTEYIDAEFKKGFAEGKWEYYRDNKLSEVTHYANGLPDGDLIRYYPDGTTIREQATMKEGKVNGIAKSYSSEGVLISEKGMKNGIDDGPERRYDEKTGKLLSETNYVDGKEEGKSFSVINSGGSGEYTRTAFYKKGKYNGEYSEVYANGTIKKKGNYTDGKKEGLWESFKKDGARDGASEVFKEGKVVQRTTYYTDGSVEMIRNLNAEGLKHGTEKKYAFDGGHLTSELNYANGKQTGKQMRRVSSNTGSYYEHSNYNADGKKDGEYSEIYEDTEKVKTKGQYVNGKKNGKWVYGHKSGNIYKEETYDNDKLTGTQSL